MLQPHSRVYRGPERRLNRVFVTRNSEYHCHDDICVAVVNRSTGQLEPEHPAVGRRLTGSVRFDRDPMVATTPPEIPHAGEQLCFTAGRGDPHEVVTSSVVRIERPPKEAVARYAVA